MTTGFEEDGYTQIVDVSVGDHEGGFAATPLEVSPND